MKAIYIIILLLIFSLPIHFSYGQKLNGKVKSYRDTYYSVHEAFGKIKKGAKINDSIFNDQEVVFDQKGNITQVTEYNSDGSVYCKFTGSNDYVNNMTESVYVRFDPETTIDRKPFIIESVKYSWGEMCAITYKNNPEGLPIEETIYDLMGRELYQISIKRDEKGNPVEYDYSDGTIDMFKYDDNCNRIEWFFRSSSGKTILTVYKNDSSGNLIEENINDSFKSYYHFHYEHNDFIYKYDKHGNWAQRIDYEHDICMRMVIRAIEYYSK